MAHDIKFFEHFFEHGEEYSGEKRLEMLTLWHEFMKENQHQYGFSDEDIAKNAGKLLKFQYSMRLAKATRRLMELAQEQMDAAAARMDERLVKAMEENGNKPIVMFPELLKKRDGN